MPYTREQEHEQVHPYYLEWTGSRWALYRQGEIVPSRLALFEDGDQEGSALAQLTLNLLNVGAALWQQPTGPPLVFALPYKPETPIYEITDIRTFFQE